MQRAAFYGFMLMLSFALPACKVRKAISGTEVTIAAELASTRIDSAEVWMSKVATSTGFKTLSAKVNLTYTDQTREQSFAGRIRVIEDSAIWLSVAPLLGIEVVRALVTRDSVLVVDRLNKRYLRGPHHMVDSLLGVPFSFVGVQALLTGAVPFAGQWMGNATSMRNDSVLQISTLRPLQLGPELAAHVGIDVNAKNNWLMHARINEISVARTLRASYSGHANWGEFVFPEVMIFEAVGERPIKLQIEWSKPEFGRPIEVPFNIPQGYEPMR